MSRLFTTGFEFSSFADNGILSADAEVSISEINPRLSAGGNGGVRSLEANTTGANLITFQTLPYSLDTSFFRIYFRIDSSPSTHEYIFYDTVGGSEVFKVTLSGTNGPLVLNVNGSDVDTGSATFLNGVYYSLKIDAVIDGSGSVDVYINDVIDISYSGATNGGGSNWNQIRLNTDGIINYDDLAINDNYTRVNYDGGNGTANPSGTLTGPSSSATIINHVGDGVSGYFIVENTGVPFSDDDAITDSGSFAGDTNGDEDASNTTTLPEGFVQLFFPDGNGNTSDLTNSDENSTDNYTFVDDFEDTSNFVFGESAGIGDTYTLQNIPSEAVDINHVDACHYTKRDGATITSIRSTFRVSGTDYDSYTENILGSFTWVTFPTPENPDTQDPWTVAELDDLEMGPKIES